MLSSQIRCVVGIDVAKASHVICALDGPSGAVRQRATRIEATAEGSAQLRRWLVTWGEPPTLLIGLEATGVLWEPLYDTLTQAGYTVVVLNPRQTSSWSASLGLRAKTDGIDAHPLAQGLLAGYGRASTVPSEAIQSLRALRSARRDLVQSQSAARQRLQDDLVVLFPELLSQWPHQAGLVEPALLTFLSQYSSAQAVAQADLTALTTTVAQVSEQDWGEAEALALLHLAQQSAASTRAVAARSVVVRTLAVHLLDLRARLAELEAALAELLQHDPEGHRLQEIPGIGPQNAATIRAELGDVSRFSRVDQVVAYAGLEPRTHESGRFIGQKRLSKRGPGALRHALSSFRHGRRALSCRVARALSTAGGPRSRQERGAAHALAELAQDHLPSVAHRRLL